MAGASENNLEDTLPCRHEMQIEQVEATKELISGLATLAPELLVQRGISVEGYDMLLRAAVESLRGTASATTGDKRRFLEAILSYGREQGAFIDWEFVGTGGRQDYRVFLDDGIVVGIEAKGCPDGNNLTIWDRPGWASEFIVWCMCPESLAKHPGHGVWSGIATRLLPDLAAKNKLVDAMIFWDARCGTALRRCPKEFGVDGELRAEATRIPGQDGRRWIPPPCVYLFPQAPPHVGNNPKPRIHTLNNSKFVSALLQLFNVPVAKRPGYVHSASIEARGTSTGREVKVEVTTRCWPDNQERRVSGKWKKLRRE